MRSYLKEQCKVDGKTYFKCVHSDTLYEVPIELCDFQVNTFSLDMGNREYSSLSMKDYISELLKSNGLELPTLAV